MSSEAGPGTAESLGKRLDAVLTRLESATDTLHARVESVDAALQAIARQQPTSAPEAAPFPAFAPAAGDDWQSALLGRDLAEGPALDAQRRRLLGGVLAGDPAAAALVGLLLLFRSAAPEKMSALLKDIGEAYYRWRPQIGGGADDMEQALVASLLRTCEQAGISNTIELVHPGERFDAARHNASERGVEVVQPLGWIVLRDNGKVYTKASVAVK